MHCGAQFFKLTLTVAILFEENIDIYSNNSQNIFLRLKIIINLTSTNKKSKVLKTNLKTLF